jgi:oligoendopeptidase F
MERDTALKTYHHFFEDIFRKQVHIRSEEVETLLGLLRDPFAGTSAIARMLTNADIHFQPAVTEEGEQVELMFCFLVFMVMSRPLRQPFSNMRFPPKSSITC